MRKAIIFISFFLSAPALAQDGCSASDLSDKAAAGEAGLPSSAPAPFPALSSGPAQSSGFLSLIIDPSFSPAKYFEIDLPSFYFLYGKSLGKASWMFGLHASRAFAAAGKLQYDFTSASVRPGAEVSLLVGAAPSKEVGCDGPFGKEYDCRGGELRLAGGASAGFFLKADVSRSVSVSGRLGASIKPLTVKDPDLSEDMWLFYLGVEMQWRLF